MAFLKVGSLQEVKEEEKYVDPKEVERLTDLIACREISVSMPTWAVTESIRMKKSMELVRFRKELEELSKL